MNNPIFLTIFSFVFILLGSYNVFTGSKHIRAAYERGVTLIWYKQIKILIGIEYILLALVFIVSTLIRSKAIPPSLNEIVVVFYFVVLIAAALFAGLVIRQAVLNGRIIRAQSRTSSTIKSNGTNAVAKQEGAENDVKGHTPNPERRRERRRNAAAARRRRAGKA
jgi:glucan phosphoethanolaminetransferase (alkaline phosphatase superfamily)